LEKAERGGLLLRVPEGRRTDLRTERKSIAKQNTKLLTGDEVRTTTVAELTAKSL